MEKNVTSILTETAERLLALKLHHEGELRRIEKVFALLEKFGIKVQKE